MDIPIPHISFAEFDPKLIPVVLFVVGGAIAITAIVTRHRRQKAWYEVVRVSIEKGQPLSQLSEFDPNSLPAGTRFNPSCPPFRTPRHDIRSALILIAVSAGLYLGFSEFHSEHIFVFPGFSAVPGFIGVALLINALINVVFPPKHEDAPNLPPKL